MKILVLTHESIYSESNMGVTARALLAGFDASELCQINIRVCSYNQKATNTFVIPEKELVKSIFNRKNYGYQSQTNDTKITPLIEHQEGTRNSLKLLLRDAVWNWATWQTEELETWLQEKKLRCIFVMPGDSTFIYKMAMKLSNHLKIPIVSFFGDDYTQGVGEAEHFIKRNYQKKLRSEIKSLCDHSSSIVFISDSLKRTYAEQFSIQGITVATPYQQAFKYKEPIKPYKISYIGNLNSGRFETMKRVCELIDDLNQESVRYDLSIYAPSLVNIDLTVLNKNHEYYKGYLNPDEQDEKRNKSDILLHIETFSSLLIPTIKHSFSTKLASYLASGRLIVAFGPQGLNSIDYLEKHEAALVAHNDVCLAKILKTLQHNEATWQQTVSNALTLAQTNHEPTKNAMRIRKCIEEAQFNET